MTKKDLVAIAKKLAANCAQDSLEEILQSYRFIALEHANEVFSAKCKEAIELNAEVKKLQNNMQLSFWEACLWIKLFASREMLASPFQ